jgi:hypothetical protein
MMVRTLEYLMAGLYGFWPGAASSTAYLLLGGSDFWNVPIWAKIVFFPGFVGGYQCYRWGLSENAARFVGVIIIGLSYALCLMAFYGAVRTIRSRCNGLRDNELRS